MAANIRRGSQIAGAQGGSYILEFNRLVGTLDITPYRRRDRMARTDPDADEDAQHPDAVLVDIDQARDLAAAYPNFFLDVGVFTTRLRQAVSTGTVKPRNVDLRWWYEQR